MLPIHIVSITYILVFNHTWPLAILVIQYELIVFTLFLCFVRTVLSFCFIFNCISVLFSDRLLFYIIYSTRYVCIVITRWCYIWHTFVTLARYDEEECVIGLPMSYTLMCVCACFLPNVRASHTVNFMC